MARSNSHRVGIAAVAIGLIAAVGQGGLAAAASPASASGGLGQLSRTQISALRHGATHSVIVVFKNQESALPATKARSAARSAAVAQIQRPVLSELDQVKAAHVERYSLLNAVSATVTAAEARRLASDSAVAEVVPNQTAQLKFQTPEARIAKSTSSQAATTPTPTCQPGPDGVELDPEALSAIHANADLPHSGPTAASLGITGAGVKVAFIAEGFNVNQPNFARANGDRVVVDHADFTGEGDPGTSSGGEASLDASSIAAQGNVTYDASLAGGGDCKFRVLGAAPGASLVALKAFPDSLAATTTALLDAINYAVTTDHVNVLNESFGYNPLPDTMTDVIRMADEAAVRAGTVVSMSTGDAGPTSTVGSPSTDPAVLSSGASTTYRTYAQEDIENYDGIGADGWENNNLSGLSSGGFTEGQKGPNLIAPGDLNWDSCNPAPGEFDACISGGTSEAAPLTSATAALVIQAYRKTHGGATPSPALVKQIITSTATDLGLPAEQQGAGLLNSYRAVLAAESIKTTVTPKPKGLTLQTDTSEISATAPTHTTVTSQVAVTNSGDATQSVHLHGRILSAPVTLSNHSFKESGDSWEKVITFRVRPGTSYLAAHAATVPGTPQSDIDVTMLDPAGRLAIDGLPQGDTAASNVGVRHPGAGKWTAFVTYGAASASSDMPVNFTATGQRWRSFGSVSPRHITLAPDATQTVSVSMRTPATAGDESAAVELDAPAGQRTSIPVALRSLVPFRHGRGWFATSVLGGNGRGGAPSSTHYFAFDVPQGRPELNLTTAFRNGPANQYSTYLVSPQGETLGHASNQLVVGGTAADPTTTAVAGAVSHVLAPAAGRWTLIVAFANPASGAKVSKPLTGSITFNRVPAPSRGVPHSSGTVIPVGSTRVVRIAVHNGTGVPQSYFLDPRLSHVVSETLTPITQASGVTLPLPASADIPQWIVPTNTTALSAAVTATAPVTFDMSPYLGNFGGELNGDPQIGATSTGKSATASWSDSPVTPGVWNVDPGLTGVFRTAGAPAATGNLSLTATTQQFNSSISTTYGDFWTGSGAVHPVTVSPGQTVTLFAAISPTAAGSATGWLYLDTATDINPFGNSIPVGDQVAAIPYSYTAK